KGAPLRVVHYQSIKLQHVLVARPEIATIKDLSGKRLGVQRLGDLTAHEAAWVSEHYGLVNLILLQAGSDVERLQRLIAGNIDAEFAAQPWDLKAEREGMRRLLNMGEVMDIAQVGYVITEAKLRDTPEAVRRVIRATNRGIGIVRDSSRRDDVAAV